MHNPNLKYRADIDGLRAWAVGMVVIYHAGFSTLSGGFVGVDIFFVISGFLITKIISEERNTGQLSILRFYERRIRRIIPALAAMVLTVLLTSALWILPNTLERISASALAAMLFFANIHFWSQNNNYFAPKSETDPFLHTWSLAVEEQFYLLFPLLFLALFLLGRRGLFFGFMALAIASFVLMLVAYKIAPTATFFLPPTRAWEFLAGSLLALGAVPRLTKVGVANTLVGLGIALLIASAFFIDSSMAFPSWVTFVPVIGTVLVIQYGAESQGPMRLLLTAKPIVWMGKISYSLYLWHWPVFVFAEHYWLYRELTALESLLGIGVSILAAAASYQFVEQPFRTSPVVRAPIRLLVVVVPVALTTVAVAWFFDRTSGLEARYPGFSAVSLQPQRTEEEPAQLDARADCFVRGIEGRSVDGCYLTQPGARNAIILGDSFGQHYLAALRQNFPIGERGLLSFTSPQCPPVIGYDPVHLPACRSINERALQVIEQENVDTVILAANWFNYALVNRITFEDVASTIETLQERNLSVVVVGQSPVFDFTAPDEAYFIRRDPETGSATAQNGVPHDFQTQLSAASASAGLFFDPAAALCVDGVCTFHDGEKYLVRDYGHFTVYGASFVVDLLLPQIQEALWN